ncbi:hypothetical protein BH11PLA1_BH11PLA1_17240 [soil metagenome]
MSHTISKSLPPAFPALSAAHAESLRGLLGRWLAHAQAQLALACAHRAAVAKADRKAIDQCTAKQRDSAAALAELEQQRLALIRAAVQGQTTVRGAAAFLGPRVPTPTLAALIAACPAAARDELSILRIRLRDLLVRIAAEHAALKAATRALLGHMSGLMERVAAGLSHTGNYRAPGARAAGPAVVSAMDLTT